jgi:hypothetical protein
MKSIKYVLVFLLLYFLEGSLYIPPPVHVYMWVMPLRGPACSSAHLWSRDAPRPSACLTACPSATGSSSEHGKEATPRRPGLSSSSGLRDSLPCLGFALAPGRVKSGLPLPCSSPGARCVRGLVLGACQQRLFCFTGLPWRSAPVDSSKWHQLTTPGLDLLSGFYWCSSSWAPWPDLDPVLQLLLFGGLFYCYGCALLLLLCLQIGRLLLVCTSLGGSASHLSALQRWLFTPINFSPSTLQRRLFNADSSRPLALQRRLFTSVGSSRSSVLRCQLFMLAISWMPALHAWLSVTGGSSRACLEPIGSSSPTLHALIVDYFWFYLLHQPPGGPRCCDSRCLWKLGWRCFSSAVRASLVGFAFKTFF